MKVALITDVHVGARNESQTFLDAHKKLFKDFIDFIQENKINEIWMLGDFFDNRKYVSSKCLNLVREHWADPLLALGVKVTMLVGNHDTYYKNTNTPNMLDEFFCNYSNVEIINNNIKTKKRNGKTFAFVPWVNPENQSKIVKKLEQNSYDCVLGHFDIQGMLMQGRMVSTHGFEKSFFKNHNLVLSGHYHKKSQENNIMYLGNPFPISWGESDDPHGWHVLDTNTLELTFYEYNANLYQRIIIDTTDAIDAKYNGAKFVKLHVRNKNEYHFQQFLNYLKEFTIVQLSIVDESDELQLENTLDDTSIASDDLLSLLLDYVDSNIKDEEKQDKIKGIIKEVYNEI